MDGDEPVERGSDRRFRHQRQGDNGEAAGEKGEPHGLSAYVATSASATTLIGFPES